jgi:hypothetical protein
MKDVSRSDLEGAARQFFERLRDEVDQPRDFPDDHYDQELDFQLASTRDHIGQLDDQLRSNRYSPGIEWTANELVRLLGASLPELTEQLRLVAMQLAARAEREQMQYLTKFGLWKPGRATHVMRHTIIARLRALEVAEEDISAFVGHSGKTMTSRYGGAYPLARKAKTSALLNYGFDLVDAVGGPYDSTQHAL